MEIDDWPLHWEATLMGKEFWKDIDEWEKERDRREAMKKRSPSSPPNLELESSAPPQSSQSRRWSSFHSLFSPLAISHSAKNTDKNQNIASSVDSNLHKRFPFNLEPGLAPNTDREPKIEHPSNANLPQNPDPSTSISAAWHQHRRKFSMSDIKDLPLLNTKLSFSTAKERIRELNESLAASPVTPSPTRSQGPWTPTTPHHRKLDATPPNMFLSPSKVSVSARKMAIEEKELPKTPSPSPSPPKFGLSALIERSASSSSVSNLASRLEGLGLNTGSTSPKASETGQRTLLTEQQRDELRYSPASYNIATFAEPLMNFRGGDAWDEIPNRKPTLGLDLFWPQDDADGGIGFNCLSVAELEPLFDFRRLRSLKLTGMLQSYQSAIWQVVWLNPDLQELELGMTLEPEIKNKIYENRWKVINDKWTMEQKMGGTPSYYGDDGCGELHDHIGYGEYLDKLAIEKAKVAASSKIQNIKRRFTIRKLTLSGFVVDADPFVQWFDPETLRGIHFKDHCVDAGFWLPLPMRNVVVRSPRAIDIRGVPLGVTKVDMKDLKVVEIHKGVDTKVMSYQEYLDTKDEDEDDKTADDKKAGGMDLGKTVGTKKLDDNLDAKKLDTTKFDPKKRDVKKPEGMKLEGKRVAVSRHDAKKRNYKRGEAKKVDTKKTEAKKADENTKNPDTLDDKSTI